MTCSECGHTVAREAQLHRIRRRYAHLALAIFVLAGISFHVQYQKGHRGWPATMPTRVLLASMPYVDRTSPFYAELSQRAAMDMLTAAQWEALIKRCAEGDANAHPPDEAWRRKYGAFIWQARRSMTPQWFSRFESALSEHAYSPPEQHLLGLPPFLTAAPTREVWPTDEIAWASISIQEWWPARSSARLTVRPLVEGIPHRTIRYSTGRPGAGSFAFPIGQVSSLAGLEEVPFDVEVQHRRRGHHEWHVVETQRHVLTIRSANAEDVLFEPVGDEHEVLAEATRRVFEGEVVRWATGRSPVRFRYAPHGFWDSRLNDIAIGVVIELRRGEDLARRLDMWWLAGTQGEVEGDDWMQQRQHPVRWEVVYENSDLLAELDQDDERWRIHIRGDRRIAMRAGDASRYWAGELEFLMNLSEYSGEAPPPVVWFE